MTALPSSRLRLAMPWLRAALLADASGVGPAVRASAAEWLAARGARPAGIVGSWRDWLLAHTVLGADATTRFPAGPCVRAQQAGLAPRGTWACARPVHLLTAIDHLQVATEPVTLGSDERASLVADLDRHLAGHGYRLHDGGSGVDLVLECELPTECAAVEPDLAAGRNVRDLLPTGRDGARVRSLMNELQMLLHEHPVNVERARRGRPTVNALWLWGFGSIGDAVADRLPPLRTDDAWLAGIWRLHGAEARFARDAAGFRPMTSGDSLAGWSRPAQVSGADALESAESAWLAPAREALIRGELQEIVVLMGDRELRVDRRARLRFWRRVRPLGEVLG